MKKHILLGMAMLFSSLTFAQNKRRAAEVFLQISNPGKYSVYLDDELVGSSNGRFRFYDVYNSAPTLSIIQGDKVIFKQMLRVFPDQRLVINFDNSRLAVLKQLNIYQNRKYALNDFDQYTDGYYSGSKPSELPTSDLNYRLLSPEAFQEFYDAYKKENFDDGRIRLINVINKNSSLTTVQIKSLLKSFSFDDERLKSAKILYKTVADPQNYFTISDVFQFPTNKENFLKFLEKP